MKILFVMRSSVYVRNFESTLRTLLDRGHQIHVAFLSEKEDFLLGLRGNPIDPLREQYPGLSSGVGPIREAGRWSRIVSQLRLGVDYLRYLEPRYQDARKLRKRGERGVAPPLQTIAHLPIVRTSWGRYALARALRTMERAAPESQTVLEFVRQQNPDLLLVTPLVEPGSPQNDYIRAARTLGIRTGLCVYSWDNLTNKGLIQNVPDLVTVWNDVLKQEAIDLHGVPADRIVVTGAQPYDQWFEWRPSTTREEFCAKVGLRPDRPFVLYLCSSRFIAPQKVEMAFVRDWIGRLRGHSDPILRDVGVLVRPHPQNHLEWQTADLSDLSDVVIWPREGKNPVDASSKADYFDSIYHCAAVMGVNTSAQIESAVIGRPVHTWKTPEFRDTQEGTLHFHHLTSVNGGLLRVAESFEQHAEQVRASLAAAGQPDERSRRFVAAFVRPFGLTEAATPRLVAAIEQAARQPAPAPRRRSLTSFVLQQSMARLLPSIARRLWHERSQPQAMSRDRTGVPKLSNDAEAAHELSNRQIKAIIERASRTVVDSVDPDVAYTAYAETRAHVLRMLEIGEPSLRNGTNGHLPRPEGAEAKLLSLSSPNDVIALRRRFERLTGINAHDYRSPGGIPREDFVRKLNGLIRLGGPELVVPDSPLLGAAGYEIGAGLFNTDRLTLLEGFVALKESSIIGEFQAAVERRVVWQIGSGGGSFAAYFKALFPNVTIVISDVPERFLLSAVYLRTAFPEARLRFFGEVPADDLLVDASDLDFVFVPDAAIDAIRPKRCDLTVNIGSLQHMSPDQAEGHVRHAAEIGSRFLYLMIDETAVKRHSSADVRSFVGKYFWPHETDIFPKTRKHRIKSEFRCGDDDRLNRTFGHVVGWKRIIT